MHSLTAIPAKAGIHASAAPVVAGVGPGLPDGSRPWAEAHGTTI